MYKLNLNSYLNLSEAEGPGKRFVIWTQGCLKRCSLCCNTQMQDIKPIIIISCDELIEKILQAKKEYNIEGITIVGGEPFLQAKGLSYLTKKIKENSLSVIVFSGYILKELQNGHFEYTTELLKYTDILIDGEYKKDLPENKRNWCGSKNQKFHYLSNFYEKGIEYKDYNKSLDIRIGKDKIIINGFPYELLSGEH